MHKENLLNLLGKLKNYYDIDDKWWPASSRFEIMLGAILGQNTSWNNAQLAIKRILLAEAMHPEEILTVSTNQLQYLIRPAGFFKQKAEYIKIFCWWYLINGGYKKIEQMQTEELRKSLLNLKGIGPETADDIILYAFGRPAFIVDTYARRLLKRYGLITGKEKYDALKQSIESILGSNYTDLYIAHAAIVEHCKVHCKKSPDCQACSLDNSCEKIH